MPRLKLSFRFRKSVRIESDSTVLEGRGQPIGTDIISVLLSINKAHVGVVSFVWRMRPIRSIFRCGSTDINNFIQIF